MGSFDPCAHFLPFSSLHSATDLVPYNTAIALHCCAGPLSPSLHINPLDPDCRVQVGGEERDVTDLFTSRTAISKLAGGRLGAGVFF